MCGGSGNWMLHESESPLKVPQLRSLPGRNEPWYVVARLLSLISSVFLHSPARSPRLLFCLHGLSSLSETLTFSSSPPFLCPIPFPPCPLPYPTLPPPPPLLPSQAAEPQQLPGQDPSEHEEPVEHGVPVSTGAAQKQQRKKEKRPNYSPNDAKRGVLPLERKCRLYSCIKDPTRPTQSLLQCLT